MVHFKFSNLMYCENYLSPKVFSQNYKRNFSEEIGKAQNYLIPIGTLQSYLRYNENGISPSSWKISEKVDESDSFTN